jgi:hypothetical protein
VTTLTREINGREIELEVAFHRDEHDDATGYGRFLAHSPGFYAEMVAGRFTDTNEPIEYDDLPDAIRHELDRLKP